MSDYSQGEGWWQASDSKWYPPEQASGQVPPDAPTQPFDAPTQPFGAPIGAAPSPMGGPLGQPAGPPPAAASTKSGLGTGPIVGIVIAVVVIIGAIAFFATRDSGGKKNVAATESSSSSSSSSSSTSSSSSASGAPTVVAPQGFTVFSNDRDRFALAIPETMEAIDLTAGDIDRILQQLAEANPQLAKIGPQIKSVFQSGGKLFAIDQNGSGFSDNVNIIATKGVGDVTGSGVKSQVQTQLESVGGTNVTFGTQTVHGRKILTTSYELPINNADGTATTIHGRQALVGAAGQAWAITLSTGGADNFAVFSTIVETFDVSE
jgi:hypothetical protein